MPLLLILIIFCQPPITSVQAQNPVAEVEEISLKEFLNLVRDQYPLYKAALLQEDIGAAKVLEKRGAFDPKLMSELDQKYYTGSNYWRTFSGGAKWQSPFGIRLSGGVDWADGLYLNPQQNFPESGLAYAGIELPLLNGLFFDEFRGALREAQLYREAQLQLSIQMRNDIIALAARSYLELARAEEILKQFQEALRLSEDRYEFVQATYEGGDFAAIDTLEAFMQIQQRRLQVRMAENDLFKSKADIETLLPALAFRDWRASSFQAVQGLWPERDSTYWLETLSDQPELRQLQIKQEQLLVEQRVIQQQFMPKLDLKYQWLTSVNAVSGQVENPNFSLNDYKWGVSFAYPIPFRKARGRREVNRLKQLENQFKLQQKQQSISAKLNALWQVQENYALLIADYAVLVNNYQRLLEAEQIEFSLGESSVFLLNARENKLIEARLKFIDLQVKSLINTIDLAALSGDIEKHLNL